MTHPASVQELTDGLMRRGMTIAGLRCYPFVPADPKLPAMVVTGPIRWTYDEAMEFEAEEGVLCRYWRPIFEVALYVSSADFHGGQRQLHAYMAPSGTKSLLAAIYGDPTLGGVADDTKVLGGLRPPTEMEVAGVKLLSCSLEVEVHAM